MFDEIIKNVNDAADMMDEAPYPYVALIATPVMILGSIATTIFALAITTKRRIEKIISIKVVLNEDEGE